MISTLVFRSLRQHQAGALIAAASTALACGLLLSVWNLRTQAASTFSGYSGGFDAVISARGSKLQAVLHAIFHLDHAPGLVTEAEHERIRKHPAVALAIPLATGDNYQGWRLVGTEAAFFETAMGNIDFGKRFHSGSVFEGSKPQAVLGSLVAQRTGLGVGSHFHPSHGVSSEEGDEAGSHEHTHEACFDVCGVLAPTNSPLDRVIWVPLHTLQTMDGHDERHADSVTALLVKLKSPSAGFLLEQQLNRGEARLTFAYPIGAIVAELFERFAWVQHLLGGLAWLVGLVAASSVFAALSATLHGRKRELAILRSLGASPWVLFRLMLSEAALIGGVGVLGGFLVYGGLASVSSWLIQTRTGLVLSPWFTDNSWLWIPSVLFGFCTLAGLWPAFKASRLPVVDSLAPES